MKKRSLSFSQASTDEKSEVMLAWLDEHKAKNPVRLDLSRRHAFTECMLVVTATSVRHAQSLADGVAALCKERAYEFLRMEGVQGGQWILLDCNDIIVHIFQEPVRELYKLESLWAPAPKAAVDGAGG